MRSERDVEREPKLASGDMTIAQAREILKAIAARGPVNDAEKAALVLVEYLEKCIADIQARGGPEVMA